MTAHLVPPLRAGDLERAAERDAAEQVIAVDAQDQPLGVAGKLAAHQDGQLHRAFSILVFNTQGELLLQRRAASKYHFANYWSNTCCGHPRPGETTPAAAGRRLKEEFGIRVPLSERAEFVYRAEDQASGLIEHEYLHVFTAFTLRHRAQIRPRSARGAGCRSRRFGGRCGSIPIGLLPGLSYWSSEYLRLDYCPSFKSALF